ncbi:unnamed protein product [Sphenostylis stenocarpa]|uniref:Uncharacterized protein n=1 Tax=Sphenostylis stenocarpa TaxID=92480 RepID=A0AA86T0V5_9FABA|nr:unnamed protein product [Sphenostylis stenocarpa]
MLALLYETAPWQANSMKKVLLIVRARMAELNLRWQLQAMRFGIRIRLTILDGLTRSSTFVGAAQVMG